MSTTSFNSLFEMPGVLVFGLCGFLSFVGGDMWVLLWRVLCWFCGGLFVYVWRRGGLW